MLVFMIRLPVSFLCKETHDLGTLIQRDKTNKSKDTFLRSHLELSCLSDAAHTLPRLVVFVQQC